MKEAQVEWRFSSCDEDGDSVNDHDNDSVSDHDSDSVSDHDGDSDEQAS